MEGYVFISEQVKNENPIIFGSSVPRRMFPLHTAPDRMGIEMGLRGAPNRGPTTYQPHPVTTFLQSLDTRPKSKQGWYFGGRTSSRSPPENKSGTNPGPGDYQRVQLKHRFQCNRPFGKISPRFSPNEYHTISPGPGRYEDITSTTTNSAKQIFKYSFGGKRVLLETARVKCTNGIPEKCDSCSNAQIGDYYENEVTGKLLCPSCFNSLKNSNDPMREKKIKRFGKVRDCSTIHKHNFPGYTPKVFIKTEDELRRLKQKEGFFRRYFSD